MTAIHNLKRSISSIYTWWVAAALFLMAFAIGLTVYLLSGYDRLLAVCFPASDCFYLKDQFTTLYFSPEVKHYGNTFASIGIMLCLMVIAYLLYKIKGKKVESEASTSLLSTVKKAGWYPMPLLLFGAFVWYQGHTRISPSGDEIFSAVNCSEAPLFRTLAYYMLPNNHMFFNVLVHVFSRLGFASRALTVGRALSGSSYLLMLYCSFVWFSGILKNRLLALLASIPCALQYTTFIFALQNRGYELQLLLGWVSFILLLQYFLNPSGNLRRYFGLVSILGFATVPSYLYFFAAQMAFCASKQLYERKFDRAFLRTVVFIGIGVYLFYLPALCFSGLHSLTSNEYVKPLSGAFADFMPGFYLTLKMFVETIFSYLIAPDHIINMLLFLTPLLLLFSRQKQNRYIVTFYIFLWLSWGCITFYMQRFAFTRSMTIHYSTSLSIVVYTVYWLIESIFFFIRQQTVKKWVVGVVFALPLCYFVLCQYKFCFKNENFAEEGAYGQQIIADISQFGPKATVGCSPNSFCYFYYARAQKLPVNFCPSGRETYYINYFKDSLPAVISAQYMLVKRGAVDCDIYMRK